MEHLPVLKSQILELLSPAIRGVNPVFLDGTFGRGGHTRVMLENFPQLKVIALDRDPEAISYGESQFAEAMASNRLQLKHTDFLSFAETLSEQSFDAMLLDLGVSSPQLDKAERGFSFYHQGPLDMRMNPHQELTARDVVMNYDEEDLIRIFKEYGEVFKPYRVVRALVHDRKTKDFTFTQDLAGLIERVDGWRRKGIHPATLYFQALRIEVNQELAQIEQSLENLVHGLKPKGRIAVLTFHSLEDRIVKRKFKALENLGLPVNKKVIIAEPEEVESNPRSRSAKLRVFEKN